MRDDRERRWPRRFLWIVVLAALTFGALATFRTGVAPSAAIEPGLPGIGRATPIAVELAAGGRGLGAARIELVQGERVSILYEKEYRARPAWAFWGPRAVSDRLELVTGSDSVDGLEEGEATVRVVARAPGTWLRRPDPTVVETRLPVLLRPPTLSVSSNQHYPTQGGCGVVVYRVGETASASGVRVGEKFFPGAPLPGGTGGERLALFAVPFDHEDSGTIQVEAADPVGNTARIAFVDRFLRRAYETDDIRVSANFMAKVVPEILAQTPSLEDRGDLVENYVQINRDLRAENAATLTALSAESPDEFLWTEEFVAMPNAQVMSAFADRRTYYHEGSEIDRQDHLGFDLASVRRAEVPAANAGRVVLAEYFGIYGNTVVVDHGFGLLSLYGHLSELRVAAGQPVERGEIVGRTGETGLAAGDHLHFTMLLRGEAVNPVEWWDKGWIRDRLKRKLGRSLPFQNQ